MDTWCWTKGLKRYHWRKYVAQIKMPDANHTWCTNSWHTCRNPFASHGLMHLTQTIKYNNLHRIKLTFDAKLAQWISHPFALIFCVECATHLMHIKHDLRRMPWMSDANDALLHFYVDLPLLRRNFRDANKRFFY